MAHYCPVCAEEIPASLRCPNYICPACMKRAVDAQGRPVRFFNEDMNGGFLSQHTGPDGRIEEKKDHTFFIDGRRGVADEGYYGGIAAWFVEKS